MERIHQLEGTHQLEGMHQLEMNDTTDIDQLYEW